MKHQARGLCDAGQHQRNLKGTAMAGVTNQQDAERIYRLWDDALGKKDLEASLSLYAEDASIESPLVQHLMKTKEGIVRGRDNLRRFIALVFQTNPPQRKRFKTGFFTDGRVVTWEYPRAAPEGDQMELVEVMEIQDGLIQRHRVYWGWYALTVLNGG
jgi:predicted SnoaL-like aldol condensation-catalyzing enzyme